jgi:hypothetical protein
MGFAYFFRVGQFRMIASLQLSLSETIPNIDLFVRQENKEDSTNNILSSQV